MRLFIATALLATLAAPVAAQNSHCAALPATARVEVRGPDNVIPAQLTPRGFTCPRGFVTETVGPVTRCRQPGPVRVETAEPRRDCYASLPLGPVRGVPGQARPTMQCPTNPTIDNIIAVRGANVGWQDVTLTAPTSAAVTITHLRSTAANVPAAQNPNTQDCFPHNCRLIRLTTRASTPGRIDLTLATPNNASTSSFSVNAEAQCPGR
ncbi:hypothetical protein FJQ54_14080 [Sandaracinobacter neustonicus]|uniref:Uncharacterized protein n=1 Tax=Sandaracinobacter neustonicus TaxID=1715348 RepID=A0A501XF17_9SPHN|nr:hypothetical protein [Sandaracinobacter neustonicus]TPE59191.1 hypothetical protein FJQ54_14080 [Sandaracinobacter neustonicus]